MYFQTSAVRLDDGFSNRQSETRAAGRAGARRIGAIETLKHPRLLGGRQAWASINHRQPRLGIYLAELQNYLTATRRIPQRVIEQIINGLP